MTRMAAAIAVMLVLAGGNFTQAQPWYGPGCYGPGIGGGFAYRSGIAVAGPGFRAAWVTRGFYAAPLSPFPPWVPAYGPGWGPGYGNPFFLAPPVVVIPPPIIVLGGGGLADVPFALAGGIPPVANNAPPLGAKPGDYIVISPRNNVQASATTPGTKPSITPIIDRVAPPPVPVRPPAFDPFVRAPAFVNTDRPEPDPIAESARQVRLGRAAFAAGDYGLAADHLDKAIRAKADDPLPHFLKAQAHFAAGKYTDAVEAIRDGVKLAPDWPTAKFQPKELYGTNPERFDAQIAALRKAVDANPTDPALHFLLGYELWFTDDRSGAMTALRAAAKFARGNAMIERFLE